MSSKKRRHKLSRGIRRYIRQEKARIRREVQEPEEQEEQIQELLARFYPSRQRRPS